MSTTRIGPPGTPIAAGEARETGDAVTGKSTPGPGQADHVTLQNAPKAPQGSLAKTAGLDEPVRQPDLERRAYFGGDRGAWPSNIRRAILFAANNPDVGQQLLDAFKRGVA